MIAESYERIHRSNLVGMGVLPLQFEEGQDVESLGLSGREVFDFVGLTGDLEPRKRVRVTARRGDGTVVEFHAVARLDAPIEVDYYEAGGILHAFLRGMLRST